MMNTDASDGGLGYPETPAAEAETLSLMLFYIQDGFIWLGVFYFAIHYCCSRVINRTRHSNANGWNIINNNSQDGLGSSAGSGRRRRFDSFNSINNDGSSDGENGEAGGSGSDDGDDDGDDNLEDAPLLSGSSKTDGADTGTGSVSVAIVDDSSSSSSSSIGRSRGRRRRVVWMDTLKVFLTFLVVTYNICCVHTRTLWGGTYVYC